MPDPRFTLHSDDWIMIPFSLLWGGFAIFWEAGVLGNWGGKPGSVFMDIWGIPFVVIGQYMIWGRFLHDQWLKRRTYYGVTNRRVLTVQEGMRRRISSTFLSMLSKIECEEGTRGTLWFGPKPPILGSRRSGTRGSSRFKIRELDDVSVFSDIADARAIRDLVVELQGKASLAS
jgi:hypothetical protein